MGFFKDIHNLKKMGEEMREAHPVQEQLANAQRSMANANAMMASMAQASTQATGVMASGADAIATVTGARHTGALVNFCPVVELDLLVTMPSGVPVPVTRQEVIQQLDFAKVQTGARLRVKVDPVNAGNLWINWAVPA